MASPRFLPCPAGADDFTPLLIYVVVRASPQRLASNLAYIERYRMASKLASETQYYYIQLVGSWWEAGGQQVGDRCWGVVGKQGKLGMTGG